MIDLPLDVKEDGNTITPKVLEFTDNAMTHFFTWNNGIIKIVNGTENDNDVESRIMKVNGNAARLALILQTMRWSVGDVS